uniref:(northern house mosquito) hypothetical protein n=1 Tax=Culex pipiens TaxID=7175 RepID=A0A8D8J475_CULPI
MHYVHVARFGPASGTRPDHASGTDRGDFRRLRPPPPLQLVLHGTPRVHVSAGCVPVFRRRFRSVQRRLLRLPVAVPVCQRVLRGIRHRTWDARYDFRPTGH